ncbi:hypothetical protein HAX54_004433 [Datura stramonium]|uniref:Uncharacterized protein n=1 Tax=Datura stramonium TaxID=4076 RepID=A0ABS8T7N5_DATST|nr:hypothetical protein [Datura stramonium]
MIAIADNLKNGECSAAESTVPLIQCDHDIPLIEHTSYQNHLDSTEKENLKSRATIRHILLSNESFLSRAEELFDTDAWEPTVWKTIDALTLSKSSINMSRVSISFDELLKETCDAIEVLKSYTKVDGNSLSVDYSSPCMKEIYGAMEWLVQHGILVGEMHLLWMKLNK